MVMLSLVLAKFEHLTRGFPQHAEGVFVRGVLAATKILVLRSVSNIALQQLPVFSYTQYIPGVQYSLDDANYVAL